MDAAMTTQTPNSSSRVAEALENLTKVRSKHEPGMALWHEASRLINAMKIKEAALKAAQACAQNIEKDPLHNMIMDHISNLAVVNDISGPEIESMWSTAADVGRHDLAYNAANEIMFRAKAINDYKLASHYYQLTINGSGPDSLRASAITNAAEIVREGFITGKKDWPGAVELYEKAAGMGLLGAMFNAGNVLLWLVEAGEQHYAERAITWLTKVIVAIEGDVPSIDLGGPAERTELLRSARLRLAQMHLEEWHSKPDLGEFEDLIAHYPGDPAISYMRKQAGHRSLVHAKIKPGKTAVENWSAVLKKMGWQIVGKDRVDYGSFEGMPTSGTRLLIKARDRVFAVLVFEKFSHPEDNLWRLQGSIALMEADQLGFPVFYVNSKGYFVQFQEHAYSVLHVAHNKVRDITPIWPGATADEVLEALSGDLAQRFCADRDDFSNCIPRLVNALDEGMKLNGDNLPDAIWLRVGDILCLPIHRPEEPERIGLKAASQAELLKRLQGS
jgi:hypothetical protein